MAEPARTTASVMCGRSMTTATAAAPASVAETETRPAPGPAPVLGGDSLTHAFLSKRRTSPVISSVFTPAFALHNSASTSASSRTGTGGSASGADAAALSHLRDYAPSRASAVASSRQMSQSEASAGRTTDASGSAQALLALMETKRRAASHACAADRETHEQPPSSSASPAMSAAAVAAVSPSPSVESSTSSLSSFASSSTGRQPKRALDADDSDADSVRTVQSAASSSTSKAPPKRKFRKATHTVRKEEKAQLLHELAQLEAQMSALQRRALDSNASQTQQQKLVTNAVLRDVLQQQLARFADAQVLFSEYGMTQVISPISIPLRLGRDRNARLATLRALKEKKFALARAFLARRTGALDPRKPYCDDQRFETPCGDYCAVRFSVVQFEGVASVRQVFDILKFYFCNIEISISEKLGNITIREDDDMQDPTMSQNRLVGTTARGVLIESNTIMFSEYVPFDAAVGGEYALLTAEFVDDDALYPYRPEQRVRKDINAILELTSHTRVVRTALGDDAQELVVVLTRWSHSRLRRPEFRVAHGAMHEMRENMERWGESMHRIMRETLYPDA